MERLASRHVRNAFCCGKLPLDEFIRRLVSQFEKRDLGQSYVAVRAGEKHVLGYYTIASGSDQRALEQIVAGVLPVADRILPEPGQACGAT